jgi:hypothetical protein
MTRIVCSECNGVGTTQCDGCGGDGTCATCGTEQGCPECSGDGHTECEKCDGLGEIENDSQ